MSNFEKEDSLKLLEQNKVRYQNLITELNYLLDENNLIIEEEELESIEEELNVLENIVYNIKTATTKIISKILKTKFIKENDTPTNGINKESLAYNEILLYQGKPHKALENITNMASGGNVEAQFILGRTYLNGVLAKNGDLVLRDKAKAFIWLQQSYNNGFIEAGYLLGVAELKDNNISRAIDLFEGLSRKNHMKSLNELLLIYKNEPKYKSQEKYLKIFSKIQEYENY